MPPMTTEQPPIQDRILDAARKLFLSQGYNGSNLRDIAREANVSMGGIYHHFESKEDIYKALLGTYSPTAALQQIVKKFQDPSFPENLADIGVAIFAIARENRDYFKLMYIDVLEFQSKNVRPLIQAFRDGFTQISEALLKRRMEAGELHADVHPAVMMRSMFDLFLYFVLEEVMLEQSLAEDLAMDDAELAAQMARVLLHGVMAR